MNTSKKNKAESEALFKEKWDKILVSSTPIFNFKKNQALFYQGHFPCGVYVVISGTVDFIKDTKQGLENLKTAPLYIPIGADFIFCKEPYPFSAIAQSDGQAYFIPKSTISS